MLNTEVKVGTFRRDRLLRLARAGKLVCVDSYSYDEMTGTSRSTVPRPVVIVESYGEPMPDGKVTLRPYLFEGYGRAYADPEGRITLYVHSNCNYTFRVLP